jgi:acetyl esterase/lipase
LFTDQKCRDFWKYDYLHNHIDNVGIKNIDKIYKNFLETCKDYAYTNKIRAIYSSDSAGRRGHLIRTYKSVDDFRLDLHIFLPDSSSKKGQSSAIVFFHGGSWTEGKPDWFFESCRSYAKKGWVACAVEFRIVARHNTLPFEAVKDARSAIRWLRKNASQYSIDTNKIIVSGNSSGGHLALATALADSMNEKTDELRFSSVPNVVLVNAGVFDLTDRNTTWISAGLRNKNIVKEISPVHLVKRVSPHFLIIHGINDLNCPYPSAEAFVQKMKKAGNNIEFHSLEGAGHFIWYDSKYSSQVSAIRSDFLKKMGY